MSALSYAHFITLHSRRSAGLACLTSLLCVAPATAPAQTREVRPLEEVIVSAQKRNESLQDVPVPVGVVDATALLQTNQPRLQDYYASVPGLSLVSNASDHGYVAIRGITTGAFSGNPTVGVLLDDLPYGSSTSGGGGSLVTEIDPSILRRIEVLRGPQGTLYGADSIGGLIKYVTVDPSTDAFSAHMQLGTNSVRHADDLGYNVRATANIPLSDSFAILASGFTREAPGYIDNVQSGQKDYNRSEAQGGRVAALWQFSADASLKLSALLQDNEWDGNTREDLLPGVGEFEQSALRGTGVSDDSLSAYGANLHVKLGSVDLTSLSSYSINKSDATADVTWAVGGFMDFLYGLPGASQPTHLKTEKFAQEVRLAGALGPKFDWLLGVFYTDERTSYATDALSVDPATGTPGPALFHQTIPRTFEEYAAFANLSWHLTDRFDIQFGGRQSRIEQSYSQVLSGDLAAIFGGDPQATPEKTGTEEPFTYLLTPTFRINPEMMVYARFASGYRPGGVNGGLCDVSFPCHYDADKTKNYEIGMKGDLAGGLLSIDASVFYIDWDNIQLLLLQSGQGFNSNAGAAKSQGVELAMEIRPAEGTKVAAWAAYTDATLEEGFPPTSTGQGRPGDRLPHSSRVSGNLSIDQEFGLWSGATGFVGASVSYVGDRVGLFQPGSSVRQEYPSYAKTDARLGVNLETWSANLYVSNIADKRALSNGGLDVAPQYMFTYIQPRTIGLTISKSF